MAVAADLVDDVFVVFEVVLEVEDRIAVVHRVVDRRTRLLVVLAFRQHNLAPHTHSARSRSHS